MERKKSLLKVIFTAFACAVVIKLFFLDLMITQGRSMLPTITPGAVLLVNKAAYGVRVPGLAKYLFRWAAPHPGDIVVFYTPMGEIAVKRCSMVNTEGQFFAMGDNDTESFDSRSYGFIPQNQILGRVRLLAGQSSARLATGQAAGQSRASVK
jgi:signal peptidase I